MKAIVLAGGHATRLWPITRDKAKPLLPLNGRPIIDYIIRDLEENQDVDGIYISTNRKFAGDFEDYLADHGYEKAEVVVEDQRSEEEKPGTIGAIIELLQRKGEDDYLIIGGDNYYSLEIEDFLQHAGGKPSVACFDVGSKEKATSFGVVEADNNHTITGFQEKPDEPRSTLASTACYFFPEDSLELFTRYDDHFSQTEIPEEQYLDEPGRLIEWAHKQRTIRAYPFTGHWFDVGTREGYLDAQQRLMSGKLVEGEVKDSNLKGNVHVMEGATVEGSNLEHCIVFPGAEIRDSRVSRSIVDENASLHREDVADDLVGRPSRDS